MKEKPVHNRQKADYALIFGRLPIIEKRPINRVNRLIGSSLPRTILFGILRHQVLQVFQLACTLLRKNFKVSKQFISLNKQMTQVNNSSYSN